MKLDPVLVDSRNYFGRPSYGFPWSRLGERPRIHVPYERFQNISEDFWEPIVPASRSRSSRTGYDSHGHEPITPRTDYRNHPIENEHNYRNHRIENEPNYRNHRIENESNYRNHRIENEHDYRNRQIGNEHDYRNHRIGNEHDYGQEFPRTSHRHLGSQFQNSYDRERVYPRIRDFSSLERELPITVERNSDSRSRDRQKKYEYLSDGEEDEEFKLACKLSLVTNQNNNGVEVRRRRSHSGGRNPYASDIHNVIEIDDDIPPVPPPRTSSLNADGARSSSYTGRNSPSGTRDRWLSDDSDSEIQISLVPIQPKISKAEVEKKSNAPEKVFYIGSSEESLPEELYVNLDDRPPRYGHYEGTGKSGENFCDLYGDGDRKSSKSDKTVALGNNITPVPSYPAYNVIRSIISEEGRQLDSIHGDGNCFFRALSKIIYGSESCHEEVRQAVVDIMEKYPKEFEQFIDTGSIHDHIVAMRKLGTWGTQAEIYGAATLLQSDVYVLSPDHTGENYCWLLFSPRFACCDGEPYHCYLTLCHTNGNHYDRIAPLHGDCNCHLVKPRLSGVRAQIDLTDTEIV